MRCRCLSIIAQPYAEILKDAKYRNSPRIVYDMARLFACELLSGGFFDGVDMVVPVPLHSSKLARRGTIRVRI